MKITYHGVARAYFESLDSAEPYAPPNFESVGFVHTTEGREALALILTHVHGRDAEPFVILHIDQDRVTAPIRYDDPAEIFPHVYGRISRDAVVAVEPAPRAPDGTFCRPCLDPSTHADANPRRDAKAAAPARTHRIEAPPFTHVQGQYLAFIREYTVMHGRPPAEADLQRFFRVTPPAVHNMILTLEKRGLIARVPGSARSIQLRLPTESIPRLETG